MRINCSTQKNERATAYPYICINEASKGKGTGQRVQTHIV